MEADTLKGVRHADPRRGAIDAVLAAPKESPADPERTLESL